jgi:ABC-type dipeptide/oligopeptide/nickel transport systems, permease components
MLRFIVRRIVGMVFVLFVVSVLVFLIFNVIPNSPPAQRLAGKNATPTLVKSIEEEWGFDEPLPVQYTTMMKKVFNGELIQYSPRIPVDNRSRKASRRPSRSASAPGSSGSPSASCSAISRRSERAAGSTAPSPASPSPGSRSRSSCSPPSSSTSSPTSSKYFPTAAMSASPKTLGAGSST